MSDLKIRQFEPGDADAVWRLHETALGPTGALADDGPWNDDLRAIQKDYVGSGGNFFVGFVGDELVAMGAIKPPENSSAEIKRMRVATQWQRRGFGKAMLSALEGHASRIGCNRVWLDTSTLQVSAQEFYKSCGYSEFGRGRFLSFDLILYEKQL